MNERDARGDAEQLSRQVRVIGIGVGAFLVLPLLLIGVAQGFGYWQVAVLMASALFIMGAFVGFLFGVPKVAAAPAATTTFAQDGQEHRRRVIDVNTNLEQISDWLTKIIVGLGLVELKQLPDAIFSFTTFISPGFHDAQTGIPSAAAVGTTMYFPVLGFLSSYLLTRLYLASLISQADARLGGLTQERVSALVGKAAVAKLPPGPAADLRAASAANDVRRLITPATIAEFRSASILWVDDNPGNNKDLIRAFRELGITVDLSASTEDALVKLSSGFSYRAIISDMGRKDDPRAGYTLLSKLRERNIKIPVLIYASSDSDEHRREAVEAGASDSTNQPQRVFQFVTNAITSAT